MRNQWIAFLALLTFFFMVPSLVMAQDSSSMTGTVTDATGAVVPGTVVLLSNKLTGAKYTQTTDKQGSYHFLNVSPGAGYTVAFTHDGFASFAVSEVSLQVGLTRTQDAKLQAGKNEKIEVSATNAEVTLNTTDASIGNNIDVQQLNQLPVLDRTNGIATLFMQQPGVDSFQGSVTGARIDQTSVTVDGMDVNDLGTGQAFSIVANAPVDSVDQFTGTVGGLASDLGTGSGGQFQLVTKSGTNKFHGNINEYHRDTTTEANAWFNNLNGVPRAPLIRNQFGGNIGGPILKNKLFFFFDYAGSRIVQSQTNEPIVPLPSFYSANPTLNYINNGPGCNQNSRINTQPDCISSLSATQVAALDPGKLGFNPAVTSFIASRYPAPNDMTQGDGVNSGGYLFNTPTPDNEDSYVGRIDYNLSSKHKIFGRFTITRENAIESLPQFPTDPVTHPFTDRSYSYVVSDVWSIGQNKVNQFYYGDTISKLDFPDIYNPTGANQYSFAANPAGLTNGPYISGPYTAFDGQSRRIPVPMVRDDFNWLHGSHSINFGGTFKFIKTNSNLINNFNFVNAGLQGTALTAGLDPTVRPANIGNDSAGVAVNDYDTYFAAALGVIGSIQSNYNYDNTGTALAQGSGGPRAYRFFETELYAGDSWKVNSKLTLTYGLRYQLYSVPYEVHGDESVPANYVSLNDYFGQRVAASAAGGAANGVGGYQLPLVSYELGGKANHGPNFYSPSYKDFAPRFAFSFSPYSSGKTVFNGSAAIVYDRTVINAINFLQDQISYLFENSQINESPNANITSVDTTLATIARLGSGLSYSSNLNPPPASVAVPYTPFVSGGVPNGAAQDQTNFIISQNLKDPYSISLNAGVQQELPGHVIMKLNYVGRLGRRLLADADAGQALDYLDTSSGQQMSAAFAAVTRQVRAGGTAQNGLTAQPWFENILPAGAGVANGFANNTSWVASLIGQQANRGDLGNALVTLAGQTFNGNPILPLNVGLTSQFAANVYLTNQGSSNYHGLLLTINKNMSQGLRFDFNYTWSHSIDNASLSANNNSLFSNTGLICTLLNLRACRGSSDFDVRQEISSNFTYDLPVGRGKQFLSTAPRWLNEAVGGWSLSGLPSYRTGLANNVFADAFLASVDNSSYAIFNGNKNDLKTKINIDRSTNTVYGFAGGAAGASKALNDFTGPVGFQYGQRNLFNGPGAFYFDAGLAKTFPIIADKVNLLFRADAFNVFNHPVFQTPNLNIVTNASPFGQITGQIQGSSAAQGGGGIATTVDGSRVAQFSLRLEF
jgi:hypothetical protein